MTLQQTIVSRGLDHVVLLAHDDIPVINIPRGFVSLLRKYWDDDDFTDYVHKIRVSTPTSEHYHYSQGFPFYMCDLEKEIREGVFSIHIVPELGSTLSAPEWVPDEEKHIFYFFKPDTRHPIAALARGGRNYILSADGIGAKDLDTSSLSEALEKGKAFLEEPQKEA